MSTRHSYICHQGLYNYMVQFFGTLKKLKRTLRKVFFFFPNSLSTNNLHRCFSVPSKRISTEINGTGNETLYFNSDNFKKINFFSFPGLISVNYFYILHVGFLCHTVNRHGLLLPQTFISRKCQRREKYTIIFF